MFRRSAASANVRCSGGSFAVRSGGSVCSLITLGIITGRSVECNNIGHERITRVQGNVELLVTVGACQRDLLAQGPPDSAEIRLRGRNLLAAVRARKRRVSLSFPRNAHNSLLPLHCRPDVILSDRSDTCKRPRAEARG